MVGDLRPMATVRTTGVAYEYCLFLDCVSALSMPGAWIDGVLVV